MSSRNIPTILQELKSTLTPDSPKVIKDIFTPKYHLGFVAENEFERLVDILQIFSFVNVQRGSSETVLRRRLLQLLAFYIIEGGCTKEARNKACKFLSIEKGALNSLNHTLRRMQFLKQNPMRTGDDRLSEELEALRDYHLKNKGELILQISIGT